MVTRFVLEDEPTSLRHARPTPKLGARSYTGRVAYPSGKSSKRLEKHIALIGRKAARRCRFFFRGDLRLLICDATSRRAGAMGLPSEPLE
jgi:hypothetical protein